MAGRMSLKYESTLDPIMDQMDPMDGSRSFGGGHSGDEYENEMKIDLSTGCLKKVLS